MDEKGDDSQDENNQNEKEDNEGESNAQDKDDDAENEGESSEGESSLNDEDNDFNKKNESQTPRKRKSNLSLKGKHNRVVHRRGSKLKLDEETKMPGDKADQLFNDDSLKGDISSTLPFLANIHQFHGETETGKKAKEDGKNENEENVSKMSDINKRAGTFVEFGSDQVSDVTKAEALKFDELKADDSSDEDDVYPLSVKYERKKVWKVNFYKYLFLFVCLCAIIPYDAYLPNETRYSNARIGYFADRIYTKSVSISGVTEISINTKNCIVYLLENTSSSSLIDLYVSASRSTTVSSSLLGTTQSIYVQSDAGTVQCYAEIKIPGGVTITKLSFNFNGDTIENLQLYDYKGNSKWTTPMIITTLSFTISNSYPTIMFQNAHQISSLTVSGLFCNCDFQYMKIASMTFTVSVGSLNILQNSAYTQNSITVKTPHGTHCIAGATVNTVDSNCPSQSTRNSGISGTYVDTTTYCQSVLYVCSNSAASCPSSGTAVSAGQGSFTITLDDGPVQFLIDGSTTTSSSTYNPTFDSFSITSQIQLSSYKSDFSSYTNDPRIYLYEVISPGYKRMWVHSSLEQYIQARPWLISMLSLNILTPTYIRDRLIHIPDATCPTNSGNNVKKNTLISKKLTSLVYTESVHLIGQKANDTYYEFKYTVNGDYVQSEITMFSGSSFILLSVIISCLISAFSVVVMFFFLWRIRRIFGEIYNRYLEENRKLAKFKNEQDIQNRDNKRITSVSQANQKILKILKLGMFTANIEEKIIEIDDKNDDHSKSQSKKRATVTFFKAPELYIDYFQRSRSNSLRMFLKSIYESPSHFPEYKLSSEVYYKEVSTRIDLLKSKYIEFCTKEGYKPRLIEEEAELLKEYNIELDIRSDSSTNAYVNIRWKTISEKLQTNQGVKLNENNIDQSEKKFNPIVSFLESECLVTSFKSNFILVSDLLKKYDKFCKDRNIPQIMKLKLEESNEMVEFGADFIQNFSIPFVRGIILTKIYGLKVSQDKSTQTYLLDVVRIPKVDKNNYRIGWMKTLKRKLNYFLFSSEGIITNLLIVLIHLLIIIGVPFLILLAVTWSLIQISTINQDIYAYVFTFDDIFNSSSYNFWLDNLTGQFYFYIVCGLCCMFFITGLIELICYYATGARDTGKYVVSRTWQRIISTYSFWAMIILFVGIYTAYLSMILVWCILGAVLNPQKFLPFATGAVVIIGFCVLVFAKLKEINDTLKDVIHSAVDIGFKNSISTSFEKEKVKLANLMIKPIERVTQRMFYQAINSFMKDFNLPQIDRETTDKILEGDVAELVLLFNKACGVDKNVSLGLVGLLLKDNVMIMNSIYNLSEENALNGELSVAITEIALNSYNPANIGINEVDSSVILSVKKLFSKLLPQFPHDILDTILQIILEADPRPLGSMWKKMQFKKSFYDLIVGIAANDKVGIQDSLYKFINDIIPNEYKELFTSLHHITKGDLSDNFDYLSQKLNVKYGFLLKMVIAVYMKEDHLTRYVLNNFDKNLSNVFNEIKGGNNGKFALLKNHIRVIHQMLNGSELDIVHLIKRSNPEIDTHPIKTLKLAADGDMDYFSKVVDALGLSIQKKGILEFFKILMNSNTSLLEIGKILGVEKENIEVLKALFKFTIVSSKLFIYVKPKAEEIKNNDDPKHANFQDKRKPFPILNEYKIRYNEALNYTRSKLEKCIHLFIKKDTIKVKSFGIRGIFSNISSFVKEAIDDLGGEGSLQDILDSKSINSRLSDAEIDYFEDSTVENIVKGDQKICKQIIDSTIEFLKLSNENIEYLRALLSISTAFLTDVSMEEIRKAHNLQKYFRSVSEVLGIGEEHLEFLLDLISGSPFRLFKIKNSDLNFDQKNKNIIEAVDQSRLNMINRILGFKSTKVNQIASQWLNSYKLICNDEEISNTFDFCRYKLKLNPIILLSIFRKFDTDLNSSQYHFTVSYKKFISFCFDDLLEILNNDIEEDRKKINPFYSGKEEIKEYKIEKTLKEDSKSFNEEVLFDSPFKQTEKRSKADVIDYIKILETLININKLTPKTIKEMLKCSENNAKFLNKIFTCAKDKDLDSMLDMIDAISSKIVFPSQYQLNSSDIQKGNEESYNSKIDKLNLSAEDKSKHMTLQFLLLFSAKMFIEYFESQSYDPEALSNKKLNKFISKLNKFLPKSKNLNLYEIGLKNLMNQLFCTNFFRGISQTILYTVFPELKIIHNPETIVGVIVGLALLNRDLVRVNLCKLLVGTNNKLVKGLIGVIINNASLEKDINHLCKKVKIKADLTLNLLKMIGNYKKQNVFNPCLKLCDQHCSSAKFVAGIVSIFKNDLTNIRVFTDYFGVDKKLLLLTLACASRRPDLLHDNYNKIAKAIEVESEVAVKLFTDVHAGVSKSISKLTYETEFFTSIDKTITRHLFVITKFGMKMRGIHNPFDVPVNISGSLKELYIRLCKVIGYDEANEDDQNIKIKKKKKKKGVIQQIEDRIREEQKQKEEVKKSRDIKKDKLFKYLKHFIMAVWGDISSEISIKNSILNAVNGNKVKLNKIWSNFPTKTTQILKKSFRGVYYSAVAEVLRINKNANKRIRNERINLIDKKIIRSTTRDSQTSFHKAKDENEENDDKGDLDFISSISDGFDFDNYLSQPDYKEIEESFTDKTKKICFGIGCTVNIAGYKLFAQDYVICETCTKINNIEVKICLPCAEFCHLGHTYHKTRKYAKIICSCGGHHFTNLTINTENPLNSTKLKDKLRPYCCSLLKMNSKFLRIRKEMYKDYQREIDDLDVKDINSDDAKSVSDQQSERDSDSSSDDDNEKDKNNGAVRLKAKNKINKSKKDQQKNFNEEIENYTSDKFIKDLIKVFDFDKSTIYEKCPKVHADNLFFYDESLERKVHLYEYFILLARGYCRPGLVRILAQDDLFDNSLNKMYSDTKRFNSIMAFISLQQGDFEYFEKTCRGIMKALGISDNLELSVEQKALRIFLILKGSTHYTSLEYLSGVKGEYEHMFRKIFINHAKSLMYIHKLATFEEDQLLYLFKAQAKKKYLEVDIDLELNQKLLKFRKDKLNFDDEIQIGNDAEKHGYNVHRVFNLPIPNDLLKIAEPLNKFISKFCLLIASRILDGDDTKAFIEKHVFNLNNIDKYRDPRFALISTNLFLGKSFTKPPRLFECTMITNDVLKPNLLKALFEFQNTNNKFDILKRIVKNIIIPNQLFSKKDPKEFLDEFHNTIEYSVLKMFLSALNGNLNSIGYCSDHIFYENKSSIMTIMCSYPTKDAKMKAHVSRKSKKFDLKLTHDFKQFIVKIIRKSHNEHILDFIDEHELDKILFLLLFGKSHNMKFFNENIKEISFVDKDILKLIKHLCTEKVIPDLSVLFDKIKHSFNINQSDTTFMLKVDNFKPSAQSIISDNDNVFRNAVEHDEMLTKYDDSLMKDEFNYEKTDEGFSVDGLKFIQIILQCVHKDLDSVHKVIKMLLPLYQSIPDAYALINSIFYLSKDKYKKIFNVMPILVKLILLSKYSFSKDDIDKRKADFKLTDNLVDGAASLLNVIIIILYKNKYFFRTDLQREKVLTMLTMLESYNKKKDNGVKLFSNIDRLADFILLILGLSKSHLELIQNFANQIGCFDQKAIDLFNIFKKYKDIIFRNGISNIPKFSKQLISDALRSAVNVEATEAREEIRKALAEGMKDVVNVAKENATNLSKAAKVQMKKVSKLVPENMNLKNPTEIFSDIFKKYDTDHSGYIDFNEFEEFCKSMGLYMDKDKMQRIYSKADLDNDYQLDMQEFQYSIILMKVEIAIDTLKKLGMTTEDLIWFGIIGLVLLLMLFAFIFFGISAFSKADVFNSVINSIMPITAGIAVAARRLDLKAEIEKVKTFVQSILAQYRKKL